MTFFKGKQYHASDISHGSTGQAKSFAEKKFPLNSLSLYLSQYSVNLSVVSMEEDYRTIPILSRVDAILFVDICLKRQEKHTRTLFWHFMTLRDNK